MQARRRTISFSSSDIVRKSLVVKFWHVSHIWDIIPGANCGSISQSQRKNLDFLFPMQLSTKWRPTSFVKSTYICSIPIINLGIWDLDSTLPQSREKNAAWCYGICAYIRCSCTCCWRIIQYAGILALFYELITEIYSLGVTSCCDTKQIHQKHNSICN